MEYFFQDKKIEESMIKSCLLFDGKDIRDKKNNLFQKFLLSLIINHTVKNTEDIKRYIKTNNKSYIIDDTKIKQSIQELENKGLITYVNNVIELTSKTKESADNYINNITKRLDKLVDDVYLRIKQEYISTIQNSLQIKQNIKECINYYYRVSGYSFFNIDDKTELENMPKLEEIASKDLRSGDKEKLSSLIIYSIGLLIESPTEEQHETLEILAKAFITSQIMGIDPLLNNFKSTKLKDKEFILDTDIVLHAITKNASLSKQYQMMIKQLLAYGCKLYIPEEIIKEVYDHAEAAIKRFPFVSFIIDIKDNWVQAKLKNVFIEDYYFGHEGKADEHLWRKYIGNYFNRKFKYTYTKEQIEERLGNKIKYQFDKQVKINDDDKNRLEKEALTETVNTEKALFRTDDKNEEISKTDTLLYLTIKRLNEINNEMTGNIDTDKGGMTLSNKTYLLTNTTRVHTCAKKLGLGANIICKPSAILAYLAEIGVIDLKITSLFDNPFILHTCNQVWEDVKTLISKGVDVSGKNIVTLRYELQEEVEKLLTDESPENYKEVYDDITAKGYTFKPEINVIMNDSKIYKERYEESEKQNKEKDEIIEKQRKLIQKQKYEYNLKKFGNRSTKKTLKKWKH